MESTLEQDFSCWKYTCIPKVYHHHPDIAYSEARRKHYLVCVYTVIGVQRITLCLKASRGLHGTVKLNSSHPSYGKGVSNFRDAIMSPLCLILFFVDCCCSL